MGHYFRALGADLNGTPYWGADRPLYVAGGLDTAREALVNWFRAQGARKVLRSQHVSWRSQKAGVLRADR